MFGLFARLKTQNKIRSTIVFDERYCHSAAGPQTQKYEIREGTTEIEFVFENFDEFIDTYLIGNRFLPEDIKRSIPDKKGFFCAQVLDNGLHLCTNRVSAEGRLSISPQSLRPLNRSKRLREFSNGAIAFGIFRPPDTFAVLWATMYKATNGVPAS